MDSGFAPQTFKRTDGSRAFETFWHSLRGGKLIPSRDDFQPTKARRFLGDIVLMEAPTEASPTLRIRVSGQRFDNLLGTNLTGQDHLDFMPEEFRPGVIATAKKMIELPCGLWQISPAHLVRGYATNLEITAFPLAAEGNKSFYLLSLVLPAGGLKPSSLPTDHGVGIDTAVTHEFIDLGAGIPELRVEAA
jgi:hypothetical protein